MPSRSNWIESHTDLRHHPKLQPTADELGITKAQLCGHLHFLWHWCLDYQEDGDVTRYASQIIAEASDFKGDCNAYVAALRNGGWIDNGRRMTLHNWDEYAGKLLRKRATGRTRSQRFRAKEEGDALRNGLTVPNRTEPYLERDTLPSAPAPAKKSEIQTKAKIFTPPTIDEAREYFSSKGVNGMEHMKFVMYYEARGWIMTNKRIMSNWHAAAAGWIMRNAEGSQ